MTGDTGDVAERAATAIAERTGVGKHDVAVVIGSGWSPAADALGTPTATVDMADLPGFTPPTGGDIRLDASHARGARFVARLPALTPAANPALPRPRNDAPATAPVAA